MRLESLAAICIIALCAGVGVWVATRGPSEQPSENLPTQPLGATAELPTLQVGYKWSFAGTLLYRENVTENFEIIDVENIGDKEYYLLASSIAPVIDYKGTNINGRRLWIERDTLQLARWQGLWDNTPVEIIVENENLPVDWIFSHDFSEPLWPLEENEELTVTVTENIGGTVFEPVIYSVKIETQDAENFGLTYYLDNELYGALRYSPEAKFYTRLSMPTWVGGEGSLELRSYSHNNSWNLFDTAA